MNTYIIIAIIVCTTFLLSLVVYKIIEYFLCPYVEEIVEQGDIMKGEIRIGTWTHIKRTYKNGKIIYINKNFEI